MVSQEQSSRATCHDMVLYDTDINLHGVKSVDSLSRATTYDCPMTGD